MQEAPEGYVAIEKVCDFYVYSAVLGEFLWMGHQPASFPPGTQRLKPVPSEG